MSNIVDTNAPETNTDAERYFVDSDKDVLKYAFSRKFTIHAGANKDFAAQKDIPELFGQLLQTGLDAPAVIYVHMPFCQTKCIYCGFAGSRPYDEMSRAYIDAIIKEAEYLSSFESVRKTPVRAIYFGGGTPSAMPADAMAKLIETYKTNFNLANDCEITLEGRVNDMIHAKEFCDAGFSRFSIGVQTFDTAVRRGLGRINTREEVIENLSGLVSLQKAAIIIDLIYGLPGQTVQAFVDDLVLAEELGLDGLDTYQLNVFPDSVMDKALKAEKIKPVAKLDEQGAYYAAAYEHLIGRRWRQLSISHYGRTFRERNIYNPWVKSGGHCIAMGAGAGGSLGGYSTYRMPVLAKYMEMAESGIFVPDVIAMPARFQKLNSTIVSQIEKGYFNYKELISEYKVKDEVLDGLLDNWCKSGLIEAGGTGFELTVAGKFWGVNITQALINILNSYIEKNGGLDETD